MELFYCNGCNKWITADQIETKVVSQQTREHPEEKEERCSLCGANGEDFDTMDLDEELLTEVLNEVKYRV